MLDCSQHSIPRTGREPALPVQLRLQLWISTRTELLTASRLNFDSQLRTISQHSRAIRSASPTACDKTYVRLKIVSCGSLPLQCGRLSRLVRFGLGQQLCMLIEVETRPQFIPLATNGLHQIQAKNAYQDGARFTVTRVLLLVAAIP